MNEQFMFEGKIGKLEYSAYFNNGDEMGLKCGKPYIEVCIEDEKTMYNPDTSIKIPISQIQGFIEEIITKYKCQKIK